MTQKKEFPFWFYLGAFVLFLDQRTKWSGGLKQTENKPQIRAPTLGRATSVRENCCLGL